MLLHGRLLALRLHRRSQDAAPGPAQGSGPPSRLRLSLLGPSVTKAFLCKLLFLCGIELGQLAYQPCPLLAFAHQINGRLQRAAPIRVLSLLDPSVQIRDRPSIRSYCDFLHHGYSMTRHPTPVQPVPRLPPGAIIAAIRRRICQTPAPCAAFAQPGRRCRNRF